MGLVANIPNNNAPFIDTRTNRVSREWYLYLAQLGVTADLSVSTISAVSVSAGSVIADSLSVSQATATAITGVAITVSTISASKIAVASLTAANVTSTTITCATINATTINSNRVDGGAFGPNTVSAISISSLAYGVGGTPGINGTITSGVSVFTVQAGIITGVA